MTLQELGTRVKRLEDIHEIMNLQSRYTHFLHMYNWGAIEDLFAQKTPGVTVEIGNSGVYEGTEGVKRTFSGRLASARKGRKGTLLLHMAVNPVIEVSRDGKTAKGLWHSPSVGVATDQGRPVASSGLGKYEVDYVKEDGKWKFWHFHYYTTMSFDKAWEEKPGKSVFRTSLEEAYAAFKPDKPSTYHMPYDSNKEKVFQPPPPEPIK